MLNETKVRLRARTALYEQSFGSRAIKLNSQYKKGADKSAFFSHVPGGIITYLLIAAVVVAASYDTLPLWDLESGFLVPLIIFVICGIVFVFLYCLYADFMLRRNYESQKGIFWKYSFTKEKLSRTIREEKRSSGKPGGGRA